MRDLKGQVSIHLSGKVDTAGREDLLRQALQAAGPFGSQQVWASGGRKQDPLAFALDQRRHWEPPGGEKPEGPKWFVLERRFSKDDWLREQGTPQEPWSLADGSDRQPVVVSFFSFKGGVGRTTALASFALHLASRGGSVAVIDLDLESPGIGPLLAGPGISFDFGVVDYLLEARLERHPPLPLASYYVGSPFTDGGGSIRVVPSGCLNKHYLEKLGRVDVQGLVNPSLSLREILRRLIHDLRIEVKPDVILLDVRAGLHDLGGISLSGLAHLELIFAINNGQTWEGLPLVLGHLGRLRADWVKLVHAMVPPASRGGEVAHLDFLSRAYEICTEHYYLEGEVPAFEDEAAAHHAYRLPFREALMGTTDLGISAADLLSDEHRIFCEHLAEDIGFEKGKQ
ncbi:MAG TPA: hypothetical protein VGS22_00050 [Thermoanaerobaculia bacterium]|nr:hypothetical protein [Thermoanaerobaculia bacterium]